MPHQGNSVGLCNWLIRKSAIGVARSAVARRNLCCWAYAEPLSLTLRLLCSWVFEKHWGSWGKSLTDIRKHDFFFFLFRATGMAYGSSQARGRIQTTAAALCHSHNNARSEPCLWPAPRLTAMLDRWPTDRGQGLNPHPHEYWSDSFPLHHNSGTPCTGLLEFPKLAEIFKQTDF